MARQPNVAAKRGNVGLEGNRFAVVWGAQALHFGLKGQKVSRLKKDDNVKLPMLSESSSLLSLFGSVSGQMGILETAFYLKGLNRGCG
jgi:hypothetical protein